MRPDRRQQNAVAGKTIHKRYLLDKPIGVMGRNSSNELCRAVLSWEPSTTLTDGLRRTYPWVAEQVAKYAKVAV